MMHRAIWRLAQFYFLQMGGGKKHQVVQMATKIKQISLGIDIFL